MNIKSIVVLIINVVLFSLSLKFESVTPFAVMWLALHSFYLSYKLEEYKNVSLTVFDENKKKLEKDLNTLFSNQKTVLSVINALRARINNHYGKTQKTKNPSLKERFKSIERRESEKQLYKVLCDLVPHGRRFCKWIKPNKVKFNKELIQLVANKFEVSKDDAYSYCVLFFRTESGINSLIDICKQYGKSEKEIEGLMENE